MYRLRIPKKQLKIRNKDDSLVLNELEVENRVEQTQITVRKPSPTFKPQQKIKLPQIEQKTEICPCTIPNKLKLSNILPRIEKIEHSQDKILKPPKLHVTGIKISRRRPDIQQMIQIHKKRLFTQERELVSLRKDLLIQPRILEPYTLHPKKEDALRVDPKDLGVKETLLEPKSPRLTPKPLERYPNHFDLFEHFFAFPFTQQRNFFRTIVISATTRPVCLFVYEENDEPYQKFLISLIKLIFRRRGNPTPTFEKVDIGIDFNPETDYTKISDRNLNIVLFEKCDEAFFSNIDNLKSRIDELEPQPLRFVVFVSSDRELLEKYFAQVKAFPYGSTYFSQLRKDHSKRFKSILAHLLFGQVRTAKKQDVSAVGPMDQEWMAASEAYDYCIGKVIKKFGMQFKQLYSNEHFVMKLLAYKTLVEKENIKENEICIETKIDDKIPDLSVDKRFWIEAETFFSTRDSTPIDPIQQIRNRILEVKESKFSEYWIILRNFWALAYLEEWIKEQRKYWLEMRIRVKFFTLDLEDKRLIELEEIKAILQELIIEARRS